MDNLLQGNIAPGIEDTAAKIPGYGFIAHIILRTVGVDVGQIVSIYLLLFGFYQGGLMLWHKVRGYFIDNATSCVRLEDNDTLYYEFLRWVSAQRVTEVSRDLKATSHDSNVSDDDEDDNPINDEGLFDYEKWASTKPIYYEPNFGIDSFYHNGCYFQFTKEEKENKYHPDWDKHIEIRCYGRSAQPIKDLLMHIMDYTRKKKANSTSIYRPSQDSHHGGEGGRWECNATRPSRPMDTVSLDKEQKKRILGDVNEYLHPDTARWYAARGIPHRRGYLFHGPPGTGKTSLSFALAGVFGLGIYCASLSDSEMTESRLTSLFHGLPSRCLVLLEDIDSAGIERAEPSEDTDSDSESSEQESKSSNTQRADASKDTNTQKKKEKKDKKNKKKKRGKDNVTLAGLLNIIDGAASAEGRVLIMTTNYPEKLDSALIRPGRVDLQIKFTLATHEQIRGTFTRMYSTDADTKKTKKTQKKIETDAKHTSTSGQQGLTKSSALTVELTPEKLAELAEKFAQELPDAMLSPAEIQGYLLMRKTDPEGAVAGAKEWKDKVLEAKKKGKKVID